MESLKPDCPCALRRKLSFLDEVTVASRDPKAPTVGAFLSVSENPARVASIVDLVNSGIMVLPAVKDSFAVGELCALDVQIALVSIRAPAY
jgi:hypothetical protein